MSFFSDINICKEMVTEEDFEKTCSMEYDTTEFTAIPKYDHIEQSLIVGKEIVVDVNMDARQETLEKSDQNANDSNVYYEEIIGTSENMNMDYVEPCSVSVIKKEDWHDDNEKHTFMVSDIVENEIQYKSDENIPVDNITDDQDGDEETIATFVTAAGQQLALYAVEDSEEIFAVAVYDESGEPPTNFQFLMKADVERLIGEGAVRTVKKPTQIKKELLTTETPLFFPKNTIQQEFIDNSDKTVVEDNQSEQDHERWEKSEQLSEQSSMELDSSNILYTTSDKESDITYLMMDDSVEIADQCEDSQEEADSDTDIIEQSTVQYILLEADQSDSELTFDEIQATLQNLKSSELKSLSKKSTSIKSAQKNNDQSRVVILDSDTNQYTDIKHDVFPQTCLANNSNLGYRVQNTSKCKLSNYTLNTLSEKKQNSDRQALLNILDDSISISDSSLKLNSTDVSSEQTSSQSGQTILKTKRPRKQQLTSVNRDDSEIIIQPASLLTEEDNTIRKRGKRRKRIIPFSYHERVNASAGTKKTKHKEVEIIEIDIDEDDSQCQTNGEIVEITIDDSKDKCSSDKENEIIMVGDSDEETHEGDRKLSPTLLQCEHCSRNFRQQRALDTHLRVCSKSPANSLKISAQNQLKEKVKKQYPCKICQEKFDVVVALARHVRSVHSQRKKRRPSKSSIEEDSEKESSHDSSDEKVPPPNRTRKKKSTNSSWEVKKLNCIDCGRWFPSAALLDAHCLQHGTKRSAEKQIRRCQICKKLIKSRVLFIRHLKMHSRSKQNTKSMMLQKKIRTTRQVTRKLTTLRKRGRPRKL